MPTIVQTNFTAGEVSPRVLGRVDVERYKNGVEAMTNMLPLIHGGAKSLPMLRYAGEAKYSDRVCRIIRFEFSKTEAAMLEFGHQYIRFWNQDGSQVEVASVPYELAAVYDESELFEIEYIGGADTILLFHQSHPVKRLRRFSTTHWVLDDAPFSPQPFYEQGLKPAQSLTLSAATVGSGRTFTAGGASFLEADVGRYMTAQGGVALITGYTSTTIVTCTIQTAFITTSFASGAWTITGTPQAVCTPSKNGLVGEEVTLDLTTGTLYEDPLTLDGATFDGAATPPEIDFSTLTSHGYSGGDTVRVSACEPIEYNGVYELVSASGDDFAVNYSPNPGAISVLGFVQKITATSSTNGWRSGDVGSFVQINGGLIEITAYSSGSQVTGIIRKAMTSDVGAQAGSWTLNQAIWNDANGYPSTGAFFQQRLIVGGCPAFPHTVAGSVIGEYYNFQLGLNDDDAFLYDIDSTEFDPILHIAKSKNQLIVLTSGNEFTLTGGIESPMTPTNVQVDNPSDYGANDVRPLRVGNELVFVNRTGKKVRAMGYRFESDSFASNDLTKLSEHITGNGLLDFAYQQEPESIVWAVRADGRLVTLSIDRDEGVLAWAKHETDGAFESVEAIPNGQGYDEVWVSVRRTINGSTVRYIEYFDPYTDVSLHSAVALALGSPSAVWGGLDHLEGEVIQVIADGTVQSDVLVSSGSITLDVEASQISAGIPALGYIKLLNPEIVTPYGSAQGNHISVSSITIRCLNSIAMLIDEQYVDLREFGESLLDQPPPTFTGDLDVSKIGWFKNLVCEISQANALPLHVLAVVLKLQVNPQ